MMVLEGGGGVTGVPWPCCRGAGARRDDPLAQAPPDACVRPATVMTAAVARGRPPGAGLRP